MGRGEFAYDENSQPTRMRGTVVEVTDRKTIENSLKEKETGADTGHPD
jgi:hypothetical protein